MTESQQSRSRRWSFWPALAAALLCGCASNSYMGVPLASGAAPAELQRLAQRAQAGDKRAQLELGIRYEEGRGVSANYACAEKLYRLAASDVSPARWVYVPPSGNGTTGRVISVNRKTPSPGLLDAAKRLQGLEAPEHVSC